jgi:hypothetical protein
LGKRLAQEGRLLVASEPNLRVLKPSRRTLQPGDIFRLSSKGEHYLFGRVISTDAVASANMIGLNLIYIYRAERRTAEIPSDDELTPSNLLIEPVMTNRLPWSRGYFETVNHRELRDQDRLSVHCFRDSRGWLFNEHGNPLEKAIEPVGFRGVHSFRTIDDLVSDALGISRAPA